MFKGLFRSSSSKKDASGNREAKDQGTSAPVTAGPPTTINTADQIVSNEQSNIAQERAVDTANAGGDDVVAVRGSESKQRAELEADDKNTPIDPTITSVEKKSSEFPITPKMADLSSDKQVSDDDKQMTTNDTNQRIPEDRSDIPHDIESQGQSPGKSSEITQSMSPNTMSRTAKEALDSPLSIQKSQETSKAPDIESNDIVERIISNPINIDTSGDVTEPATNQIPPESSKSRLSSTNKDSRQIRFSEESVQIDREVISEVPSNTEDLASVPENETGMTSPSADRTAGSLEAHGTDSNNEHIEPVNSNIKAPIMKPIETVEETLNEISRRIRVIAESRHDKTPRAIYDDLIVIFEGLEVQIRGSIIGKADEDDFSEALDALGVLNKSFGPPIRESSLRNVFQSYSQGEEFVDYELLCLQLLGSIDPKLLPGNRQDEEIIDIFHRSLSGLFAQDIDQQQLLLEYFMYGSDSRKDLLTVDPNAEGIRSSEVPQTPNDINDHYIRWFNRMINQISPLLSVEECLRLYLLLHATTPIERSMVVKDISTAQSKDELQENFLRYFLVNSKDVQPNKAVIRKPSIASTASESKQMLPFQLVADDKIPMEILAMDVIRAIHFDPLNPTKIHQKSSIEEENVRFENLRAITRKRALKAGDVGGEPIKEKLSEDAAALRIEKCWRSKLVRKQLRLKNIAAVMIQSVARGYLIRRRSKARLQRQREYMKYEEERINRQRRIWKQERELHLLKHLPVKDFLTFDRMKQHHSAKILQRFWRGIVNHRLADESTNQETLATKVMLQQGKKKLSADEEIALEAKKLSKDVLKLISAIKSSFKNDDKKDSDVPLKEESDTHMNVLRLGQLQRRVIEETNRKRKVEEEKQKGRGKRMVYTSMNEYKRHLENDITFEKYIPKSWTAKDLELEMEIDQAEDEDEEYIKAQMKGQKRRQKYEDLLRQQNMASVMVQEYLGKHKDMTQKKEARLATRMRLQRIKDDLSDLPSLDHPPLDKWILQMNEKECNPRDIESSCLRHVKTVRIMKDFQNLDNSDEAKYRKWSIVASPYDSLAQPMDIKTLHADLSNNLQNKFRINGNIKPTKSKIKEDIDMEESMWWVAYARQQPTYLGDGLINAFKPTETDKESNPQRELINQVVCHVNADALLEEIYRDTVSNRRSEMIKRAKYEEEVRIDRLAQMYHDEAMKPFIQSHLNDVKANHSHMAEQRRLKAIVKIQSFIRGYFARKKLKYLAAERRVANALKNLISQLIQPELIEKSKSKGNAVEPLFQLDRILADTASKHIKDIESQSTSSSNRYSSISAIKNKPAVSIDKRVRSSTLYRSNSAGSAQGSISSGRVNYPNTEVNQTARRTSINEYRQEVLRTVNTPALDLDTVKRTSRTDAADTLMSSPSMFSPFDEMRNNQEVYVVGSTSGYISSPGFSEN